jgi:hypothetical protein
MSLLRTVWQRAETLPRWTCVLALLSLLALAVSPEALTTGLLGFVAGPWAMVLGMTLVMHAAMPARIVAATRTALPRAYVRAAWGCVVVIIVATALAGEPRLAAILATMVVVGGGCMAAMALWFHRHTGRGARGEDDALAC